MVVVVAVGDGVCVVVLSGCVMSIVATASVSLCPTHIPRILLFAFVVIVHVSCVPCAWHIVPGSVVVLHSLFVNVLVSFELVIS